MISFVELEGLEEGRLNEDGTRSPDGPTVENLEPDATQGDDEMFGGQLDAVVFTYKPKTLDGSVNLLYSQSSDQGESFSFVHTNVNSYLDKNNNVSQNIDLLYGKYTLKTESDALNADSKFSFLHADVTGKTNYLLSSVNASLTAQNSLDLATMAANLNWGAYNGAKGKHGFIYSAGFAASGANFKGKSTLHLPELPKIGKVDIGYTKEASLANAELGFRFSFMVDNDNNFEASFHINGGFIVGAGFGVIFSNTRRKIN